MKEDNILQASSKMHIILQLVMSQLVS